MPSTVTYLYLPLLKREIGKILNCQDNFGGRGRQVGSGSRTVGARGSSRFTVVYQTAQRAAHGGRLHSGLCIGGSEHGPLRPLLDPGLFYFTSDKRFDLELVDTQEESRLTGHNEC